MVRLNQFFHPEKSVKSKYEYFADSIENISDSIGYTPSHPIENHLSLLQKIDYQLKNNTEEYQSKYINHYLKNELLQKDDIFLNSLNSKELKVVLAEKINRKKFKLILKTQIPKLKKKLLKKYLLEVHKLIINKNISPKNARDTIEYYSNLIVSELLFEGFSRKDIYEIPNLVIFGKTEIDPRPDCFVKQIRIKPIVKTIQTQILRIEKLCYNPKLKLQYVFKIEDLFIDANFKYKYNDISILSPTSRKMKQITPKNIRKKFLNFNGAFAVQDIEVNSVDIGLNKFKSNLKHTLNYLSSTYKGKISINQKDYHIFNSKVQQGRITWKNISMHLNKSKKERFSIYNNLEFTLAHKKYSKRVKQLIFLDKIFFKAKNETDNTEKIVLYWRYLESLFDYQIAKSSNKEKSSFIIGRVSQILITKEYEHYYNLIIVGLTNILVNNSKALGLDRAKAISEYMVDRRELNFTKFMTLNEVKKNLFVWREVQKIKNYNKRREFDKSYKFYKSILLESYEQRNFLVHYFSYFEKSIIKASLSLDILIPRLRNIIIESILHKDFSGLSLAQTLEKIALIGNTTISKK